MSIQAQLNQEAFNMLPLTIKYINSISDKRWAGNCRGMLLQNILNTRPSLVEKTSEQLDSFDKDMRNYFYKISDDERFDVALFERDINN